MTDSYIAFNKPTLTKKDLENVLDSLIQDELLTGSVCKDLEQLFSAKLGIKQALALNSLTAAYHVLWLAMDLSHESTVILPSYYQPYVLSSLLYVGARPRLLDYDKEGFFYNEQQLLDALTDDVAAVVLPYVYGDRRGALQINKIRQKKPDVHIIEELTHSFGAQNSDGRPLGALGSVAVLSLTDDSIVTTGNGALLATDNLKIINRARETSRLPNWSSRKQEDTTHKSLQQRFDYRMADFQAALAITQIKNIHKFNQRRGEIAELYRKVLGRTANRYLFAEDQPVPFRFPVILDSAADAALRRFRQDKIRVRHQSTWPLHRVQQLERNQFRQSERLYQRVIELPIYPQMSKKEVNRVLNALSRLR